MTKYFPALLLSLLATPAFAHPPSTATSIVRLADLDLNSAIGQHALDRRLSIAISEVCGNASDVDLVGQNQVRRCRVATRQHLASERDQRIAAVSRSPIEVAGR